MRIAHKLFIGFLGTILLIAFIAAYGLYHVGALRRDTEAAQVSRRNALRLREAQLNLSRQRRALERYIDTPQAKWREQWEGLGHIVAGQFRDAVVDVGLPEDEERIRQVLKLCSEYQADIRKLVKAIKASGTHEETQKEKLSRLFDKLSGRIDDVIHVLQQRVREQIGMAERDARAAYTLMFVDGVLAVVMGCTIALYISRQITNPVHRLVEMTQKIAEGDLRERVSPLTRDEIGQLGASFNRMADELEKSMQAVEEYSRSLEKKVAERTEDLRQSEEKYRSLMENAGDAIFLVDPDNGKIIEANRRAGELAACAVEKLIGKNFYDFFPPAVHHRVGMQSALHERTEDQPRRTPAEIQDIFLHRDTGEEVPVDVRTSLIPYHGGEVMCSIVRDITDRRELERQVIQTERMASLGLLAGGVAHELNNPLSSILMNTELVLEVVDENSELRNDLRQVEEDALRCKRIIEDLLSFARDSRMDRQPVSLNDLVDKTLPLMEHEIASRGIRVEKRLGPDLPNAHVDQTQIQQVLLNVLLNALQAMPEGGDLRITTSRGSRNGFVDVLVQDSGKGINPAIRERIFDPFFTTKDRGTGLGLAICYRIIEAHGGNIEALPPEAVSDESAPQGASFRITLPTAQPKGTT